MPRVLTRMSVVLLLLCGACGETSDEITAPASQAALSLPEARHLLYEPAATPVSERRKRAETRRERYRIEALELGSAGLHVARPLVEWRHRPRWPSTMNPPSPSGYEFYNMVRATLRPPLKPGSKPESGGFISDCELPECSQVGEVSLRRIVENDLFIATPVKNPAGEGYTLQLRFEPRGLEILAELVGPPIMEAAGKDWVQERLPKGEFVTNFHAVLVADNEPHGVFSVRDLLINGASSVVLSREDFTRPMPQEEAQELADRLN